MTNVVDLPVVKFKRILTKLPALTHDMQTKDLSTDQRYLYEMCEAIASGSCSDRVAQRHPGNICHSRWLTLANNVLRLYVGTQHPSSDLITIVEFILKAYAPSWFQIKINNKCFNGAENLFDFMKRTRYLPKKYRNEVEESVQRNAYYAYHENILLAMLCDSRKDIRQLSYQRIIIARDNAPLSVQRKFKIPKLRFDAKEYHDIIDWTQATITEPPLTKTLSKEQLYGHW